MCEPNLRSGLVIEVSLKRSVLQLQCQPHLIRNPESEPSPIVFPAVLHCSVTVHFGRWHRETYVRVQTGLAERRRREAWERGGNGDPKFLSILLDFLKRGLSPTFIDVGRSKIQNVRIPYSAQVEHIEDAAVRTLVAEALHYLIARPI